MKLFDPVSFGYVMATGIISIAFERLEWPFFSLFFLLVALIGYLGLILQACRSAKDVVRQFLDPLVLFKWFTFCAGTNTLSIRLTMAGEFQIGYYLGVIGILATVVLLYLNFFRLMQTSESMSAVSPLWLLKAIACNSAGIAITTQWMYGEISQPLYLLVAIGFWTFGFFIYLLLMSLNIYRMFFLPFTGKDLNPAYWTCMGAAAISVVDASNIVLLQEAPDFIKVIRPFMQGMITILWLWASAWIPILCAMALWKYISFKAPFVYEPALWAIVFPLGMYTLASHLLSTSVHLTLGEPFILFFLWASVAAWLMAACLRLRASD